MVGPPILRQTAPKVSMKRGITVYTTSSRREGFWSPLTANGAQPTQMTMINITASSRKRLGLAPFKLVFLLTLPSLWQSKPKIKLIMGLPE